MPPQSTSPSLYLQVQPQTYYLMQLKATEPLPDNLIQRVAAPLNHSEFTSITRTKDEVSIVTDFHINDGTNRSTEWRCIRVAGPMDLSELPRSEQTSTHSFAYAKEADDHHNCVQV